MALLLAGSFLSFLGQASAQTVSLTPSASASGASDVSEFLNPSFAGMGIEPSNLFSYTGGSSTNQLSVNLLQNLADYSGAPPHLRIGGNTGDYFLYDSSYSDKAVKNNPSASGSGAIKSDSMIIGPGYWDALDRFPTGTPITFGLNMAYDESDYLDRIVGEAQACIDNLHNVQLYSFEVGNEPDLWLQNGFRTGTWGGQVYTQEWLERTQAIYEQVLAPLGIGPAFFEPAATASTIGTSFEITQLANQFDIAEPVNGSSSGYVKAWNQHDYLTFIGVTDHEINLEWVVDLDNTDGQFEAWVTQVQQAIKTGIPYVLREMASVGPVGLQGVSDTFGAALWTLNFFCYAASLNITSVQIHMTDNSWASPWQPIRKNNLDPYVRPSYYAFAAFAQLVGNGNGTTQLAAIDIADSSIPTGYTGRIRAYATYSSGDITSVVLINTKTSNTSDASSAGTLTFSLNLPNHSGQTLYLSYLTATGTDSTANTTWNGLQYSNSDGSPTTVSNAVQTVAIGSNGRATVTLRDSEAVIANIGSRLGTNAVGTNSSSHTSAGSSSIGSPNTAVLTGAVSTAFVAATSIGGDVASTATDAAGARATSSASSIAGMKRGIFFIALGAVGLGMAASHWFWS